MGVLSSWEEQLKSIVGSEGRVTGLFNCLSRWSRISLFASRCCLIWHYEKCTKTLRLTSRRAVKHFAHSFTWLVSVTSGNSRENLYWLSEDSLEVGYPSSRTHSAGTHFVFFWRTHRTLGKCKATCSSIHSPCLGSRLLWLNDSRAHLENKSGDSFSPINWGVQIRIRRFRL